MITFLCYVRAVLVWVCVLGVGFGAQCVHAATSSSVTPETVLLYTNLARLKAGVPILTSTSTLNAVALRKARDMRDRSYFAHKAPTGEGVGELAVQAGYDYLSVGENLALGDFASAKSLVDAWMASPGHRENILSPSFTELGVGVVERVEKGRIVLLAVQTFGLPASVCPKPDAQLKIATEKEQETVHMLDAIFAVQKKAPQRALVTLYNTHVQTYQTDIAIYNKEVDGYNACVHKKTAHSAVVTAP